MKRIELVRLAALALVSCLATAGLSAQGLLVDQASGPDALTSQGTFIPDNQIAQSFTPSLSAVGYIQLQTSILAASSEETVVINLRQDAYNGAIISSTTPVVLLNHGTETSIFYFSGNVPVTPNQVYYFEPVLLSSGRMVIGDGPLNYDRGDLFSNGLPSGGAVDLWFREGVVVPEPGAIWLLLFGGGALLSRRLLRSKS